MSTEDNAQFGRYELLDRIGVGGMAEVWKARVAGLGGFEKILVLKKILPEFASNKTFVEMLLNEARLCAILQHANIVQTYENGEIDGQYYIAMEHVQGQDLFKVLSRVTKIGRRIPVELCLYVAAEVAKGLAYAHGAKDHSGRPLHIIHRDVSPSNVLLSENGEVKVMDFGVARATMDGGQNDNRSRAGVLKGKLGYMSPEQVTGQPFDFRSDIFSLGIILYESITLKRLFLGRTDLETLVNIRDARIEHKFRKHKYIEEPVRAILRKALARNPDDRYASALDFHDDIVNLLFQQKTQVTNRTLSKFLGNVFADPTSVDNENKPTDVISGTSKSQNSLTFSPDEIRKQQSEIRRRRAEQAERARTLSAETNVSEGAVDTAIELSGVPSRRTSRQVPQQALNVEYRSAFAQTDPDSRVASASGAIPLGTSSSSRPAVPKLSTSTPIMLGGSTGSSSSRSSRRPSGKSEAHRTSQMVGSTRSSAVFTPEARKMSTVAFNPNNSRSIARPRRATGASHSPSSPGASQDPTARRSSATYLLRSGDDHLLGPMSREVLEDMIRNRSAGADAQVAVDDGPFHPIQEFTGLRAVIAEVALNRNPATRQGQANRLDFPRLVYRLYAEQSTGCLEMLTEGVIKSIYFRKGRPVHIASNQKLEMLGPFLVNQGIVSERDVEQALIASYRGQGRLGDVLVAMNFIKPYQLYQVLEKQFRAKFVEAFGWEQTDWAFFADEKPPANIVPLDLDPVSAMVEGVRSKVPLSILEPFFKPHLDRPYNRARGARVSVEGLRLQAREAKALGILMASSTLREAVEERCRSRQQRLAILHVMLLLMQTGLLEFNDRS